MTMTSHLWGLNVKPWKRLNLTGCHERVFSWRQSDVIIVEGIPSSFKAYRLTLILRTFALYRFLHVHILCYTFTSMWEYFWMYMLYNCKCRYSLFRYSQLNIFHATFEFEMSLQTCFGSAGFQKVSKVKWCHKAKREVTTNSKRLYSIHVLC